ncbi:hypothetical protein N7495_003749 [Penicillium taxi]|uniref:uncharacterized protein n=1 Tax=Penicillium taxi TaxID=168475 RepID=UPI002544F2FB|nr:uncharacterized protein N7495_003749 [Penicillium taxi]KAJ5899005.1 hypothetical protein N7495_003749 [Penicillium taxi]
MDQTHARALEALQPFIHLVNSSSATSPRFIANLITNATSSPHTYFFAELLETPAVQSLRSPETPVEYQGYLKLLEIFAWGTWQEYHATPNLPTLSSKQSLKLRLLSLISLAVTTKPLTYPLLINALSLSSTTELESLVTTAIYASLISARLSPATTPPLVNVMAVAPLRDVQIQSLPKIISTMAEWEARCSEAVSDLEAEIARVKTHALDRRVKEEQHQSLMDKAIKKRQERAEEKGGIGRGKGMFGRPGRLPFGAGSNKRDAADIERDDGFWDSADGADPGSRMDIDEGAGSSRAGWNRNSKRILGRKP